MTIKFNNTTKYNNNNLLYDSDELINLKGNLIIGDFPHKFDSKNYYKSQFIKTYSSLKVMKWELEFNKIYYINTIKISNSNQHFFVIHKSKVYKFEILGFYMDK